MDLKQIIGHWRSKDFPLHEFRDGVELVFNLSGSLVGTLWLNGKDNKTLAEGKVSLTFLQDDKFEIHTDGIAIEDKFRSLPARMYMPHKPASLLINVPEYGERYFEKLE